jgi:hypothetical protein
MAVDMMWLLVGSIPAVVAVAVLVLLYRRRGPSRKALHVDQALELSHPAAAAGTARSVRYNVRELCPGCGGSGRRKVGRCRSCRGRGLGLHIQRRVTIRTPPGVKDGTVIRVAGRGVPGFGRRPPGDLRLRVRLTGSGSTVPGTSRATSDPSQAQPSPFGTTSGTSEPGTITTRRVQVTADHTGLTVKNRRRTPGGDVWEQRLRLPWTQIDGFDFATDSKDPIVALYVLSASRTRHYAMDSAHLNGQEWARLAGMIAHCTGHRLLLDVSRRDDPRSPRPDW